MSENVIDIKKELQTNADIEEFISALENGKIPKAQLKQIRQKVNELFGQDLFPVKELT